MLNISPFKALRPGEESVRSVAAPPYDVVGLTEANKLLAANPLSFIQVEKTGAGLPAEVAPEDEQAYRHSRLNLERLKNEGVLCQDEQDCFYLYRLIRQGHEQIGLVSCLNIDQYERGLIKRHELTRTDKELDRIRHIMALEAQTGPVFIAYRAVDAIDRLVAGLIAGEPEYQFGTDDGVAHTVWVIRRNEDIESLQMAFSRLDALYIADGHHRAAAAAEAAKRKNRLLPDDHDSHRWDYMLAVLFPHDQLQILPYNRVVKGLNALSDEEFLKKIRQNFIVRINAGIKTPDLTGAHCLYFRNQWHHLQVRHGLFRQDDPVASLPAQILQDHLLAPVLGIDDPRSSERLDFVGGVHGTEELERLVDSGGFDMAFSLPPATIEELMRVADAKLLMPPKSTWFEPKLRSGIFTHLLTSQPIAHAQPK
ncbi:MAG: DUF1015 family protein [Smithellaceae bacterium]|nr:DUF1015 family protein [Smithellaceae bacterium]